MTAAMLAVALTAPDAPPAPAPDVGETVESGLKWLASQQKQDGSWPALNGLSPTITTAYSALALLMEGSTLKDGTFAPQLRKALAWFEENVQPGGRVGTTDQGESLQPVQVHAAALQFLACVYDADDDPDRRKRLGKLLDKAVAFAAECQTSRGGWGFRHPSDGNDFDDGQCTTVVLQSLLAARKVGIEVPKRTTDRAVAYLVKATSPDGGVVYTLSGGAVPMAGGGLAQNSAGAAAGLLLHGGTRPAVLPGWVRHANVNTAQQVQFLRGGGAFGLIPHYQMARVAFALGETGHRRLDPEARDGDLVRWSAHRAKLYKVLKEVQVKDGSWPDQNFGASYSTALALIILQLDNDYLPALSR